MKRFIAICLLLSAVTIALASTAWWRTNAKPPISLTESIHLATATLNKDGGDYYCLRGMVWEVAGQCVWDLDFSSTNGAMRWVEVGTDSNVVVRADGPFPHF